MFVCLSVNISHIFLSIHVYIRVRGVWQELVKDKQQLERLQEDLSAKTTQVRQLAHTEHTPALGLEGLLGLLGLLRLLGSLN